MVRMSLGRVALLTVVGVVAAINVSTMRRVWASAVFERSQKLAQTVVLWLVPGSFFLVRHVLAEPRSSRGFDPTSPDDKGFVAVSLDQVGGGDHSSHAVDSSGGDGHGGHV
jgi:hypothetical protein